MGVFLVKATTGAKWMNMLVLTLNLNNNASY